VDIPAGTLVAEADILVAEVDIPAGTLVAEVATLAAEADTPADIDFSLARISKAP
jgi:hypothetical protein